MHSRIALQSWLCLLGFVCSAVIVSALPTITQQPASVSVVSGQPAEFTVAATGTGTVSYQWRRLGQPIADAIGNTLTLPAAKLADASFYDVEVKDGQGSTISQAAQLFVAAPQAAAIYRMDTAFTPILSRTGTSGVTEIALASDHSLVVGGSFSVFMGQARDHLARVSATMELDASFHPCVNGNIDAVAIQTDGKILIGGSFSSVDGAVRKGIARLNLDGSLDPSFDLGGFIDLNDGSVSSIVVQPDGMILVGCRVDWISDGVRSGVYRFSPAGVRDPGFNFSPVAASVSALALAPGGRIYVGGSRLHLLAPGESARLVRLNGDGSVDTVFAPVGNNSLEVSSLAVQGDGRILVGGSSSAGSVLRYLPEGTLDPAFTPDDGDGAYSVSLLLQPDGRIVVGRYFSLSPYGKPCLVRLNSDGSADATFSPVAAVDDSVMALLSHPDGGFVVGGRFTHLGTQQASGLARLSVDGAVVAFPAGPCGGAGTVSQALLLPGNRCLVVGSFTFVGSAPREGAAIIGPDGAVEPGFDPGSGFGRPNVEFFCTNLLRDAVGRFLVRGTFQTYGGQACTDFVRILPDGKPDATFVPGLSWGASVTGMMLGPRGELYVATRRGDPDICRLLDTGVVDTTFVRPNVFRMTVAGLYAAQTDGRLIAAIPDVGLRRLNTDGSIDPTFDSSTPSPQGVPWDRLDELESLADGAFLVNNSWTPVGRWRAQLSIERPGAASSLVEVDDISIPSDGPTRILPLDDGRLLVTGRFSRRGATRSIGLAIVKPEIVSPAPVILQQPANLVVRVGQPVTLSITLGGEGPFSYVWRKDGGFPAHYTDAALSFPTAQLSDTGIYDVTVTSDFGTVMSDQAQLTVHNEAFVSFSDWAADGFTAAELANPAISGPDADPEHCGLSNLLRYAFKYPARGVIVGSPTQATTTVLYGGVEYLAVSFRRKTYAPDIRYVVEGADDLRGVWTHVDQYLPGLPELVVAPDSISMEWANVGRRFLRVRVEQVP